MATRLPSFLEAASLSSKRRFLVRLSAWSVVLLLPVLILFSGNDESSDDDRAPRATAAHAPSASSSPSSSASPKASTAPRATGKHLPRARPTRLLIPAIDVDAPFVGLDITKSGQLEAPPADDVNLVGWQADGVSPGERGTAIIAGHVDTATAPAVFAELSELDRATGSPSSAPTGVGPSSWSTAPRRSRRTTSPTGACTPTPRRPRSG